MKTAKTLDLDVCEFETLDAPIEVDGFFLSVSFTAICVAGALALT